MTDLPATPIGLDDLPGSLRARVESELGPGERLLWAGRPDPRRPCPPRRGRAASLVGTLAWTALAVSLLPVSLQRAARVEPPLNPVWVFGIVGGVVALVVAFFHWASMMTAGVVERSSRRREDGEFYALSDRRAMIWRPVAGSPAVSLIQILRRSVRPAAIERIEYPDGSGDLRLHPYYQDRILRGVPRVREVDVLIRRVLATRRPPLPTKPDSPEEPR